MGENGKYTNDVQNTKYKICTSKTDVQIFRFGIIKKFCNRGGGGITNIFVLYKRGTNF